MPQVTRHAKRAETVATAEKAVKILKKKPVWREYGEAIVIAIILALFIRTFVVQAFKIPSGSMIPTLLIGDHILVNKFIYRFTDPARDEIIVFKYPQDETRDFIKRVIGLPGDTVEVRKKVVYVNGKPLQENFIQHEDPTLLPGMASPRDYLGPLVVPAKSYFVMGDNRDNSQDSRFWGFLKSDEIKGKAFLIYWSWDRDKPGPRWNRLGKLLH
ncbi:MAG TPA: signal peptidase I [bacterium]|nr:signal peptidase I [bacterium]